MAHPVVHFEIIGKNPEKLRNYFAELFGWQFDTSSPVAEAVSEPTNYGFVDRATTPDGTGIPGGIGGVPATRATSSSTSAGKPSSAASLLASYFGWTKVRQSRPGPRGDLVPPRREPGRVLADKS